MTRNIPRIALPTFVARRARWLKVLAASTLGIVVLASATDVAAGFLIRAKIGSVASHRLHAHAEISLGGGLALADAVNGRVPSVHVHATSATLCSISSATVSATLTNLHSEPSGFAVSSTDAQITLNPASLTGLIAGRAPSATAQADPAQDTIDVHAGPADAIALALRPQLNHNRLTFKLTQATILGRPLPTAPTRRLQSELGHGSRLDKLPLGLSPQSVTVASQGLQIRLSGRAWHSHGDASAASCTKPT